jgi:hypothetical protein
VCVCVVVGKLYAKSLKVLNVWWFLFFVLLYIYISCGIPGLMGH